MNKIVRSAFSFCICLALSALHAPHAFAKQAAGEILLAVGQVWIEADGVTEPARRGRTVDVGNRVVTRDGGHVHVRMSDGGLVALRPNSTLEIQVFDYDAARPGAGKVRYELKEGVARSVTGRIGEANKQSFRLNTPIAAIGVRGTDFVTQHDADATRVAVKSGAVVVGSLGRDCAAESFGACGGSVLTLAATDPGGLVEVSFKDRVPRLRRDEGAGAVLPDRVAPPHPAEPLAAPGSSEGTRETRSHRLVAEEAIAATLALAAQPEVNPPPNVVVPPPEPEVVIPPPAPRVYWGRWDNTVNAQDIKSMTALLAEGKKIHLATSVFGIGVEAMPASLPDRGRADFQVAGASAYLTGGNGLTPASVTGGNLSIDFAARKFSTDFNVAAAGNNYGVNAAGVVDFRGYFFSDPARSNATLYGVLDSTLREAGTLFERPVDASRTLTGAIRWSR
jgi:hypothetical protein